MSRAYERGRVGPGREDLAAISGISVRLNYRPQPLSLPSRVPPA